MSMPGLYNPGGVWGSTSEYNGQGYTQPMVAATAVTGKTLVALSTTAGQVVPCATNADAGSVLGVAMDTVAAGQTVMVRILGPVYGAAKSTAAADNFAQFDRVTFSATTTAAAALLSDATAVTQAKDVGNSIGIVMAAATTGATTCNIFLIRT